MSALGSLQVFYYSYLASPRSDRVLYQAIRKHRPPRILELGMGTGSRAVRLVEMAQRYHAADQVRYVGLDLFEARSACDGPGITLKLAYRMLRATGAKIQLLPGEPLATLARTANNIGTIDLAIFSARLDPRLLAETWFYVPRLLHPGSLIFVETELAGKQFAMRPLALSELATLAEVRRRAAQRGAAGREYARQAGWFKQAAFSWGNRSLVSVSLRAAIHQFGCGLRGTTGDLRDLDPPCVEV